MTRTTVDIDASVMRQLRQRQARDGRPLGRLVSELLASALSETESTELPEFVWTSHSMGALVDIEDKEALRRAMESDL
jgi:indole-3-glycerol phosphate synthase